MPILLYVLLCPILTINTLPNNISRTPLPWQIGDLVTCVVRRSTSRGCVLGIQGTNETGLLHISCMSKAFVRDPTVRQELMVVEGSV